MNLGLLTPLPPDLILWEAPPTNPPAQTPMPDSGFLPVGAYPSIDILLGNASGGSARYIVQWAFPYTTFVVAGQPIVQYNVVQQELIDVASNDTIAACFPNVAPFVRVALQVAGVSTSGMVALTYRQNYGYRAPLASTNNYILASFNGLLAANANTAAIPLHCYAGPVVAMFTFYNSGGGAPTNGSGIMEFTGKDYTGTAFSIGDIVADHIWPGKITTNPQIMNLPSLINSFLIQNANNFQVGYFGSIIQP